MNKEKKILVYSKSINSEELSENNEFIIRGIASTTNRDLDNEVISENALKSLAMQIIGLNLHLDHNHDYDGGIGTIIDAEIVDTKYLFITAKILPEHVKSIKERLDFGMNMGFSIGGIPVINDKDYSLIDDFKLLEVSLTLLPANWDSFGTVEEKNVYKSTCFSKACYKFLKGVNKMNNEENIEKPLKEDIDEETQENKEITATPITEDTVINLFNELMANKEQAIKEDIIGIVKDDLNKIVEDNLNNESTNYIDEPYKEENKPPYEEEEKGCSNEEEMKEIPQTNEEPRIKQESVEDIEKRIIKNVIESLTGNSSSNSKFEEFKSDKKEVEFKKYLNSEKRDHLGRNKKYM